MFKESNNTTEAIIELIKTLPENQQEKIVKSFAPIKQKISILDLSDTEYAKRLKKFEDFAKKNKFIPKGFKFDREEAHNRK